MLLNDKLIHFRKTVGFTQQEIADLLGVERSTYACYESGKVQVPIGKLQLLAIIYNTDINAFITSEVLVLNGPGDNNGGISEDERLNKMQADERLFVAKYRILKAMDKTETLHEIMNEMSYEDAE